MADLKRKHPANVDGPWFVDDSCIECDASRQVAPGLIVDVNGASAFARQPATPEEEIAAVRAMLACPVGSIGRTGDKPPTADVFPQELIDGVYYCGFNSPKSYGANSFFARRPSGNFLIDSPRYATPLVRGFEALGGIDHILLTHQDDVADAGRYAEHFGARVWIHAADRRAAPYATDIIEGEAPAAVAEGVVAVPVPGHTRGSVAFLLDEHYLFTGDSLHWEREADDLAAFRSFTWYSWEAQADSLERLAQQRFEWVLAGHGDRHGAPADQMHERLLALVARMRTGR